MANRFDSFADIMRSLSTSNNLLNDNYGQDVVITEGGDAYLRSLTLQTPLTGTILSSSQPTITSIGALNGLTMNGEIVMAGNSITGAGTVSASTLTGTLFTPTQPNITSLGTLSSLNMGGNITMAGNNISGANSVIATTLSGTLSTSSQPNITSLGTLSSLTVAGSLNGTLSTSSQPNVTSLGTLSSLTVAGSLNGTLSTSSQPNITSLGTLSSLSVGSTGITVNGTTSPFKISNGTNTTTFAFTNPTANRTITFPDVSITVNAASNLTGTTLASNVVNSSLTSVGTLSNLNVSGDISCSGNLFGVILTPDQPYIGSLGVLSFLAVGGNITCDGTISGTLTTAAQPNITSLGTLTSVNINGSTLVNVTDYFTIQRSGQQLFKIKTSGLLDADLTYNTDTGLEINQRSSGFSSVLSLNSTNTPGSTAAIRMFTGDAGWMVSSSISSGLSRMQFLVNNPATGVAAIPMILDETSTLRIRNTSANVLSLSPGTISNLSNTFTTSLSFATPTANRTITIPDSDITINAASQLSGTALASNVVSSSLTSLGTLTGLNVNGSTATVSFTRSSFVAGDNYILTAPTVTGGATTHLFHRYRSGGTPSGFCGTMFSGFDSSHYRIYNNPTIFTIDYSNQGSSTPTHASFNAILTYNPSGTAWNLTGSLRYTGTLFGPGTNAYSLTSNGGTVGDLYINSGGGSGKLITLRPGGDGSNDTAVEFDATNSRVVFRNTTGTGFACFHSSNSTINISSSVGTAQAERLYVAQNNYIVAKFKREGTTGAASNILFENSSGTATSNQCVIGVDATTSDFIVSPGYTNRFRMNTAIIPFVTNTADLGTASLRFRDTYLVNAVNVSSDANLKENVSTLDESDTMIFVNRLRPVKYQLIDGQSGRYHHGLIAQEFKQAITDHGLTTNDVASYVESEYEEDGVTKTIRAIRYEEIISMLISTIQNLDKRVKLLEAV